ncbi:hypothetical protein MKX03_005277 [Papaver bracteatum]|nr:hypothetical protein MKX03_005277 [Papaver bracteatum]
MYLFLSSLEKRVKDLEADKEHLSERRDLCKKELNITVGNQEKYLAHYRNMIYQQVCKDYDLPLSDFKVFEEKIEDEVPSRNIQDSDFEDDFSDEEFNEDNG